LPVAEQRVPAVKRDEECRATQRRPKRPEANEHRHGEERVHDEEGRFECPGAPEGMQGPEEIPRLGAKLGAREHAGVGVVRGEVSGPESQVQQEQCAEQQPAQREASRIEREGARAPRWGEGVGRHAGLGGVA